MLGKEYGSAEWGTGNGGGYKKIQRQKSAE